MARGREQAQPESGATSAAPLGQTQFGRCEGRVSRCSARAAGPVGAEAEAQAGGVLL